MCGQFKSGQSEFKGLPTIPSSWRQGKSSIVLLTKGESLSSFLNRAIDSASSERSEILSRLATSAGISQSTVNQILSGSIDCPPRNRLAGFARVLPVTLNAILSAAESDGCDYGRDE